MSVYESSITNTKKQLEFYKQLLEQLQQQNKKYKEVIDKAIKYKKEKRKPYTKAKAVDKSCRNHGNCKWCEDNRTYKNRKREEI